MHEICFQTSLHVVLGLKVLFPCLSFKKLATSGFQDAHILALVIHELQILCHIAQTCLEAVTFLASFHLSKYSHH